MGSITLNGYRTPQVLAAAGITMRELDWWLRQKVAVASLAEAEGSGSARRFSFVDVVVVRFIAHLRRRGVELGSPIIEQGIRAIRAAGPGTLAESVLVINGGTADVVDAFEAAERALEAAVNGADLMLVPLDRLAVGVEDMGEISVGSKWADTHDEQRVVEVLRSSPDGVEVQVIHARRTADVGYTYRLTPKGLRNRYHRENP